MNVENIKDALKTRYQESKRFVLFVIEHFFADDCTYRASALTFTTLLAIVPLMSVGFAILSTFPVFEELRGPIQDFIFENFVPTTGNVIQEYLQLFTKQVSRLSAFGIIFLFITALLVMYTIEQSMNKIWRLGTSRHGISAFLLYWAILSLAPFFLGLSIAASSYIFSMPLIFGYHAPSFLFRLLPSFLSLVGFTFLYVVVPNCRVRLIHGFSGAVVATVLFESAKKGFAFYLSQYNTYELLYGAFATIPIFFIWIYWVWLITLIGAEISYALSVHYQRRTGESVDGFSQALMWLHCFWLAQREGKSVSLQDLIHTSKQPFTVDMGNMIAQFTELKLIKETENGNYVLCRDLNTLTLYQLTQLFSYPLPSMKALAANRLGNEQQWQTLLFKADELLAQNLNISLDQLFKQPNS